MVVMAQGDALKLSSLPAELQAEATSAPSPEPSAALQDLEAIERSHILATLEAHAGNRTHAAAALRISVRTLQRKLKAWGLENYLHREANSAG
jgi:DNA-binding NtrC family response regulator